VVGIAEEVKDIIRIYSNEKNIIVRSETQLKGEIFIFDVIGQEVSRKPINSLMNVIPVHQKNTLYIVEVLTTNNKILRKVLVK